MKEQYPTTRLDLSDYQTSLWASLDINHVDKIKIVRDKRYADLDLYELMDIAQHIYDKIRVTSNGIDYADLHNLLNLVRIAYHELRPVHETHLYGS